jgi:hypothetical protein
MRVASFMPPEQAKILREFHSQDTAERQSARVATIGKMLSAAEFNAPFAVQLMEREAEAAKNSGKRDDAEYWANTAKVVAGDPRSARTILAPMLGALGTEGEKILKAVYDEQAEQRAAALAPATQTKALAEAQSAAVAARFAESKAVADLAMSEAKIKGLASDEQIKRQNVAIAAMNARIAAEGNDLKRQELQQRLADAQSKRDSAVREKNADLEAARGNIDNMLNTADRVLNTPMGVVGSAAGPVSARIPTVSQSTADFEALVETLGSQSFLAQIPNIKGMGQLSNAEGEKLQAALQNFSLKQSPEQLMRNVREAQRLLLKARQNIEARFGAAPSVPDTPASQTAAPRAGSATPQDVNELVRRYGGGG